MGRSSSSGGSVASLQLFPDLPSEPPPKKGRGPKPCSTIGAGDLPASRKSQLIATYLRLFELVTGGGLYIDGFAAPQYRDNLEAWTARRVLEQTRRLRRFWLCDLDGQGVGKLRDLAGEYDRNPPWRHVTVFEGDFNVRFKEILYSGRITPKASVFVLLDQRNTECHWSTVRSLALLRRKLKFELLYFVGISWLHRSLSQSARPERLTELNQWWGGEGWRELIDLRQAQVAAKIRNRFADELRYRHVRHYPIRLNSAAEKASYLLVHASDHEQAPVLMRRAYWTVMNREPWSEPHPELPF